MMEQYVLEPCPFCGGDAELAEVKYNAEDDAFECAVRCLKAGCFVNAVFAFKGTEELSDFGEDELAEEVRWQTVECWNRRCNNE